MDDFASRDVFKAHLANPLRPPFHTNIDQKRNELFVNGHHILQAQPANSFRLLIRTSSVCGTIAAVKQRDQCGQAVAQVELDAMTHHVLHIVPTVFL